MRLVICWNYVYECVQLLYIYLPGTVHFWASNRIVYILVRVGLFAGGYILVVKRNQVRPEATVRSIAGRDGTLARVGRSAQAAPAVPAAPVLVGAHI